MNTFSHISIADMMSALYGMAATLMEGTAPKPVSVNASALTGGEDNSGVNK